MNEVAYAKNQFLVWLELMRIAARALEKKLHSDTKDYADYLRRLVDEGWAKEPNGSCQVISNYKAQVNNSDINCCIGIHQLIRLMEK